MDTDRHGFELAEGELTHAVIGAAFAVLHGLAHGFHEKPAKKALVVELGLRKLAVDQQRRFPVLCKGEQVSESVPDLLVGSSGIVEAKMIERITDFECGPMLNHLRIAKLHLRLILNLQKPKLEWERIVL